MVPGWLPRWQQMILPVFTLALLPGLPGTHHPRQHARSAAAGLHAHGARQGAAAAALSSGDTACATPRFPSSAILGPVAGALITGSFIIEQMFSVPGTGRLFVKVVEARDYGLIMGTTLFYATVGRAANLAVDIAYAFLDPRIRYR